MWPEDVPCAVCRHPLRDDIEEVLRRSGPDGYARTAASKYAPFAVHVLREHQLRHLDSPSLRRVADLVDGDGPPPGWLFCPVCDSTNVRSKGSGDWREDPGPVHWHVTECLACGWPEAAP